MLRYVHQTSAASTFSRRNAEIDRFHWHARDDAQLTALSNLCEASSSAATNAVDSDAVLATAQGRRRPADAGTRAPAPFRRASAPSFAAPRPSRPHRRRRPAAVATAAGGSPSVPRHAVVVDDNLKSQGRSRLASMPVRPQFNVAELAAAGKQADLETERLRLKALAAKCVVELAREKTPPPPPPPLKQ
jgi:hypothetical protein